jgi:transposase InsO family protein
LPFRDTGRDAVVQSPKTHLPQALYPNTVWSYDFVHDRISDGRSLRLLGVLDEHTRECLAIEVARSITATDVIRVLSRLMSRYGKPKFIRSDQGAEFTAGAVMRWLRDQNVGPLFIAPGSPWQNGFVESFNGKLKRRMLEPRMVSHLCGGEDADREMAAVLQSRTAPQRSWQQTARYITAQG